MNVPKGLTARPFWNLVQWVFEPLELMEKGAAEYGDIFPVQLLGFPELLFISNPEAIKQIFSTTPQSFDSGQASEILKPTLGSSSLLLLDGEPHQRHRHLLMPPFHGERMRAYGQTVTQLAKHCTAHLQVGKPFSARSITQDISLGVILKAVFGLPAGERYDQIYQALSKFLEFGGSFTNLLIMFFPGLQINLGRWSPYGRYLRLRQQVDDLIYREIHDRRQQFNPDQSDILTLMMAARDEAGEGMSDQELRDELMTLLLAGHETTATALAWALYWIHAIPDVKAKLLKELDTLDASPDPMSIAALPYLSAICSETLRIYPVGLIVLPRITKVPVQVLDQEFPVQTYLTPVIYSTHHRPDLYPEPKQFRPERFLERQFGPHEYLPFGGGGRRCIGAAFALFEMKLVLAHILSHYQLELAEPAPVKPVRRGVTLAPKGGVRLVMTGTRSTQTNAVESIVASVTP
jgi:cytochrome P450 family 110